MKLQQIQYFINVALGLSGTSLALGVVTMACVTTVFVLNVTGTFPSNYAPPQRFDSIQNMSYPTRVVVETDGTVVEIVPGNPGGTNYTENALTWTTPINMEGSQLTTVGSVLFAGGVGTSILSLESKGVAGTYAHPTVTVNDEGLVTAIGNGSLPVAGGGEYSLTWTAPVGANGSQLTVAGSLEFTGGVGTSVLALESKGVAGAYVHPVVTVNDEGLVTAIANGTAGGAADVEYSLTWTTPVHANGSLLTVAGSLQFAGGAGTSTLSLEDKGVAGTYVHPTVTLNAEGLVTAVVNGSAASGGLDVGGTADEIDVACNSTFCQVGLVDSPRVASIFVNEQEVAASPSAFAATIPALTSPAEFVMTEGDQIIDGKKDFLDDVGVHNASLALYTSGDTSVVHVRPDAATVTYDLFLPPNAGGAGNVLTSLGDGHTEWAALAPSGTIAGTANEVNVACNGTFCQIGLVDSPHVATIFIGGQEVNASSSAFVATVPALTAHADFVMTGGDQIIDGKKDFLDDVGVHNASLALFTSGDVSAVRVRPDSSTVTYDLFLPPNAGGAGDVLTSLGDGHTEWAALAPSGTIAGTTDEVNVACNGTFCQIGLVDSPHVTSIFANGQEIEASPSAFVATIPALTAHADFVMTEGDQTVDGKKDFLDDVGVHNASLALFTSGDASVVRVRADAATVTYDLYLPPNTGSTGNVLTSLGNGHTEWTALAPSGTIAGTANEVDVACNSTYCQIGLVDSPQVVTIEISAATIAAAGAGTMTVPDVGTSDFVMTAGQQNVAGRKFFLDQPTAAGDTGLMLSNAANTLNVTLKAASPASSSYTLRLPPDAGADGSRLATDGAGVTSWLPERTFAGTANEVDVTCNATSCQVGLVGSPHVTSLFVNGQEVAASSSAFVATIPALAAHASFVMTEGDQFINGEKHFNDDVKIHNEPIVMYTPADAQNVSITVPSAASTYNLVLPPNGGSANRVLRTDGTGTTTWVRPRAMLAYAEDTIISVFVGGLDPTPVSLFSVPFTWQTTSEHATGFYYSYRCTLFRDSVGIASSGTITVTLGDQSTSLSVSVPTGTGYYGVLSGQAYFRSVVGLAGEVVIDVSLDRTTTVATNGVFGSTLMDSGAPFDITYGLSGLSTGSIRPFCTVHSGFGEPPP